MRNYPNAPACRSPNQREVNPGSSLLQSVRAPAPSAGAAPGAQEGALGPKPCPRVGGGPSSLEGGCLPGTVHGNHLTALCSVRIVRCPASL